MSREQRDEAFWGRVVADYGNRDCTQKEFCRRLGISATTLQYHLGRGRKKQAAFVPVEVAAEPEPREVTLDFPSGLRLVVRG